MKKYITKILFMVSNFSLITMAFIFIITCNNDSNVRLDYLIQDNINSFEDRNEAPLIEPIAENKNIELVREDGIFFVTAKSGLNIRNDYGLESEIIDKIPYNSQLEVIQVNDKIETIKDGHSEIEGKWVRVIWRNKVGWVFNGYLSRNKEVPEKIDYTKIRFVNVESGLNMRTEPSTRSGIITKIPYRNDIEVIEEKEEIISIGNVEGSWAKVRWNNNEGWVFNSYISKYQTTAWKKVIPGKGNAFVIQNSNGNFVAIGSNGNYYIIKISRNGNTIWEYEYGGLGRDIATDLIETKDGGYVIVGTSNSNDIIPTMGYNDTNITSFYLLKLNSKGEKEWDASYGGSEIGNKVSVAQTTEGGYILAGTFVIEGVQPDRGKNKGGKNFYLLKLNSKGEKEWDAMYGGSDWDEFSGNICLTDDGGFVIAGYSISPDIKPTRGRNNVFISESLGSTGDAYILKVNSKGEKEWDAMYGGSANDWATSIIKIDDGGYGILCWTESNDIRPTRGRIGIEGRESSFASNYYFIKLNSRGEREWDAMYGGSGEDKAFALSKVNNTGYIMSGYTRSKDLNPTNMQGKENNNIFSIYTVKINKSGEILWDSIINSNYNINRVNSIYPTDDGGFILGGKSLNNDFYVLKIRGDGSAVIN